MIYCNFYFLKEFLGLYQVFSKCQVDYNNYDHKLSIFTIYLSYVSSPNFNLHNKSFYITISTNLFNFVSTTNKQINNTYFVAL